jgi:hypothetical protein
MPGLGGLLGKALQVLGGGFVGGVIKAAYRLGVKEEGLVKAFARVGLEIARGTIAAEYHHFEKAKETTPQFRDLQPGDVIPKELLTPSEIPGTTPLQVVGHALVADPLTGEQFTIPAMFNEIPELTYGKALSRLAEIVQGALEEYNLKLIDVDVDYVTEREVLY